MESDDFDEIVQHAKQVGKLLGVVYREMTGEDLDLDGVVRHYPLVALGIAVGAGALGGWWLGRRQRPQLPPPPQEGLMDTFRDAASKLKQGGQSGNGQEAIRPRDYLEQLAPHIEKVRNMVPDTVREEASLRAQTWMDTVLEPKLKQGMGRAAARASDTRLGAYLRDRIRRMEEEEHHIPDEPESSADLPEQE
jgi:hypothetical protein